MASLGGLSVMAVVAAVSAALTLLVAWLIRRFLGPVAGLEETKTVLVESEERYRELVEQAHSIILRWDREGRVTFFNEFAQQFFGFSEKEIIGKHVVGTIVPEVDSVGKDLVTHMEDVVGDPETFSVNENENIKRDGTRVWIQWHNRVVRDEEGKIVEIVSVGHDMTERKEAEEEALRLTKAVEGADEIILITGVDGTIQYVNPAFERVTGYTDEEVLGRTPRVLKSGKHPPEFYEEMWNTLGRGEVWKGRIINRRKDGRLYEEEATISPLRNADGVVTNFVAVKRDVTREVQLEMRLRRAQKLEAIGTLAGGIAHDFNNILVAILGYAELLDEHLEGDERNRGRAREILGAGRRAKDLVKQILTFSRDFEGEPRALRVQSVIKEALQLLRPTIPTTIEIRQRVDASTGPIFADPVQIHQIVVNLATNAYQSMEHAGGVLELGLKPTVADHYLAQACPGLEEGRSYACFTVRDTGEGMDADTIERVFDPFFTTKGTGQGTGLGLATVHGIVAALGGDITVQSEPGVGSTFTAYLPMFREEGPGDEITEVFEEIPAGSGEEILLVDDDRVVLALAEEMISSLGYRVTCARGGEEALRVFKQDIGRFDAVVTDLTMPEMTGADLAQELSRMRPDLPIVLISGYSEALVQQKAGAGSIRRLVQKPFNRSEIASALSQALRRVDG